MFFLHVPDIFQYNGEKINFLREFNTSLAQLSKKIRKGIILVNTSFIASFYNSQVYFFFQFLWKLYSENVCELRNTILFQRLENLQIKFVPLKKKNEKYH